MFFRRKQAVVAEVEEDESVRKVTLALSTLDQGIKNAREARLKAQRVSVAAERLASPLPAK